MTDKIILKEEVKEEKEVKEVKQVKEEVKSNWFNKTFLLYKNDPLIESIIKNYIFYITSFICLIIISIYSKNNLFYTIVSFIIASFSGFVIHYVSHDIKLEEAYLKQNNYIRRNKYSNNIVLFFCKLLDFHETIHHESSINKLKQNMIIEFILNFITQGGCAMLVCYFAKKMNQYVFLLWGLMYCSVHIINYSYIPSKIHEKHHLDKKTNYGIDIWDVMLGTKYNNDTSDIEIINHYSINIIIITVIIILLIKYNVLSFS